MHHIIPTRFLLPLAASVLLSPSLHACARSDSSAPGDDDEQNADGEDPVQPPGSLPDALPDWADHHLEFDLTGLEADQRVDYVVVVSGRIENAGSGEATENGGRFGVARGSVWPGHRDDYFLSGRVLSIKVTPSIVEEGVSSFIDSQTVVNLDQVRVNHESFDPSLADLAYGFMGAGKLPADLQTNASDCDVQVDTRAELVAALTGSLDGVTVCVTDDIRLPEGPGTGIQIDANELTLVGLAKADGSTPKLYRRTSGDWGYGNVALLFSGDRVVVQDLEFEGPGALEFPAGENIPQGRVAKYEMRGIEFEGTDSFVLNVNIHHFSHANISARGLSLTVLATDTHHPWPSGRSYGVATGGPLEPSRNYPGERWPDDLLATDYTRWRDRTEIRRVLLDGGRHDTEGGTHGTYSLDQFVIGHRGVAGGRVDMHRPGGGVWRIGHGAIEKHDRGGPGVWMRGWPELAWRVHDVWFSWGPGPDQDHRYPSGNNPIVQVCATPETRVRRELWDTTNGPFIGFETESCMFGEGHPSDIDEELGYYYDHFYEFLGADSPVYPGS